MPTPKKTKPLMRRIREVSAVDAEETGNGEFTVSEEAIPEKPVSEKAEIRTEGELVPEKPDSEKVETKTDAQVVPAEPSSVEPQNDGNNETLNGDSTVVGDEKVDCGEPAVEDKEVLEKGIHEGG